MVTEYIERIRRHYTFTLRSGSTFNPIDERHSHLDDFPNRQKEADLLRASLQDKLCHLEKELWKLGEELKCQRMVASNKPSPLKRKRTAELFENGGTSPDAPAQILNGTMQQEAARVQLIVGGLELSNPGPQGMSSQLEAITFTNNKPSQCLFEVLLLSTKTTDSESTDE